MLRAILFLALTRSVIGNEVMRIENASKFKGFVKSVNGGTKYSGTTVYLDSDLALPDITEPIGKDDSNHFRGVFDGQGHVISDLKMNSTSSIYTGLFGYSKGLTIRNVVLDSSCSITSSYDADYALVGGIIGQCSSTSGQCNIENNVNMADITSSEDISNKYLYLGGIVGSLSISTSYMIHVKNCANYGSVIHSGTSEYSYIGGIVGYLTNLYYKYVYNCLNYGKITHSGTTSYLYLGGIAGYSSYAYLENCVSAGEISTQKLQSKSYIGNIVGYANSYTYIKYCYWASDVRVSDSYVIGSFAKYPYTFSYDNATFKLSDDVSVGNYTGTSLINALNAAADYYILRDYSKWLLNKDSKSVNFTIRSRTSPIKMNSQIILLLNLASEGNLAFDGWYNDNKCTHLLDSFETTEDKTLYGKFEENTNNYTISFETRREDVSAAPITAQFGAAVSLPNDLTREYCSIAFWENEYGDNVGSSITMPARNFTLYSVWKCTRIATPDDFVDFSKVVNPDTNYEGDTVYLDSDLSLFRKSFKPIYYFRGVFDGQGHIISDLKMNISFTDCTGLFGYSTGLTIRNVVLDSSCSLTSSYSSSGAVYMGGIVGYCYSNSGQCNIENSVNMADVTFSGNISNNPYLTLSGIAGFIYSYSYNSYVKNCANYGSITHSGASDRSYIGGVAGSLNIAKPYYKYIYNCLNYGAITHSGTTSYLYLGGIAGYSNYAYLENCVSAGEISTTTTGSESYIGSIVGYVKSNTSINNLYWTSDAKVNELYGHGKPENTEGAPSSSTTMDLGKIKTYLNNYAQKNDTWSKWLLNENNTQVSFIVNYGKGFILKSKIILFPNLVDNSEGSFSGWYKDPFCNELFQEPSVNGTTSLYGLYGLIFSVTFDANDGNATEKSKNVSYKSPYGELPEAYRTGHTFLGWFTEKNEQVTNETIVANSYNHILYAYWKEVSGAKKEKKIKPHSHRGGYCRCCNCFDNCCNHCFVYCLKKERW